jgi:hypothetical protein
MMMRYAKAFLMALAVTVPVLAGVSTGPPGLAADAASHLSDLTSSAPVTVVASGLEDPRSLTWGPHGHLLVADDGTPFAETCSSVITTDCFNLTGSIDDISSGTPVPVVTGLANDLLQGSLLGASGLVFYHGHLYVLELGAPQLDLGLPAGLTAALSKQLGALLEVTDGQVSAVANPGDADFLWASAHQYLVPAQFPQANPYDLTADPRGGFYLVDAGSNTLDWVDLHGHVRVLAFVPNPSSSDAVPTCVAVGRDGAVYLGELTGAGNDSTAANVYKYDPRNGALTVWQSGFSAINGCGFGANGDFYVTELDTTGFPPADSPAGAVIQISHNGTRTVLGAGKLFAPSGFLAGPDGSVYVANQSILWPFGTSGYATSGQVVKIG